MTQKHVIELDCKQLGLLFTLVRVAFVEHANKLRHDRDVLVTDEYAEHLHEIVSLLKLLAAADEEHEDGQQN
jgi:hypothetical protein